MRIGTNELLIILVVVLLIFGPKNLPKLGKMFGKTMKNFKEGMEDVDENGDAKPAETKTEEKAEKKDETPAVEAPKAEAAEEKKD